jgi:hypothetical protein
MLPFPNNRSHTRIFGGAQPLSGAVSLASAFHDTLRVVR